MDLAETLQAFLKLVTDLKRQNRLIVLDLEGAPNFCWHNLYQTPQTEVHIKNPLPRNALSM